MNRSLDSLRTAGVKTVALRRFLAQENRSGRTLSPAFLRELRHLDQKLELFWLERYGIWALYRVSRLGVVEGDDRMVKEFELVGPHGEPREPGPWLLDWLRRHDKTKGGTVDPEYYNRWYWERLRQEEQAEEDRQDAWKKQVGEDCGKEMLRYAVDNRKHFNMKAVKSGR